VADYKETSIATPMETPKTVHRTDTLTIPKTKHKYNDRDIDYNRDKDKDTRIRSGRITQESDNPKPLTINSPGTDSDNNNRADGVGRDPTTVSQGTELEIFIQLPDGDRITHKTFPDDLILQLRLEMESRTHISRDLFYLVKLISRTSISKPLLDHSKLSTYDIYPCSIMLMKVRLRGGG
jgi:hypothetical protein